MKRLVGIALGMACSGLVGCSFAAHAPKMDLDPPSRANVGEGEHLAVGVWEIAVTDDVIFDRIGAASRLFVWIEIENRDIIPARVDLGRTRLVVGPMDGVKVNSPPVASGWDAFPPVLDEQSRALPIEIRAGERKRAWVAFAPPTALLGHPPRRPGLALNVELEGETAVLTLADPARPGPRWVRPGWPGRMGIFDTVLAGPGALGNALGFRATSAPWSIPVHFSWAALAVRHNGHAEVGMTGGLQIDLPPRPRPGAWFRFTPFVAIELALARPSFPRRYPNQEVSLIGPAVGLELGFGSAPPANSDVLPIEHGAPTSSFAIRLAYVRWWGDIDGNPLPDFGSSGALISLVATGGP